MEKQSTVQAGTSCNFYNSGQDRRPEKVILKEMAKGGEIVSYVHLCRSATIRAKHKQDMH